ncbi:MAG: Nramp family divalent metal transporter, partial [Actinomycetota bacterium]|nr:Nramp family divalent metal transporter [Actinomycetota bacterium]
MNEREGTGTEGRTDRDAQEGWNIPSRGLPAIGSRDLPEPIPMRKLLGASVVILATATGSGEFVIWPYITTQIGISFLWLGIVGFFVQYVMNMEIERYTLATGETAVTGFTRLWKPWGIFFV